MSGYFNNDTQPERRYNDAHDRPQGKEEGHPGAVKTYLIWMLDSCRDKRRGSSSEEQENSAVSTIDSLQSLCCSATHCTDAAGLSRRVVLPLY